MQLRKLEILEMFRDKKWSSGEYVRWNITSAKK